MKRNARNLQPRDVTMLTVVEHILRTGRVVQYIRKNWQLELKSRKRVLERVQQK